MKLRLQAAFTLIELLVVITIIGILASFALPALQTAQVTAQQAKALSNARQIVGALRTYASDNDGKFPDHPVAAGGVAGPGDLATSNEAFRQLFPNYLTSEQIFYVPKSAWSNNKPDDRLDAETLSAGPQTLNVGENHWAYFPKLTDSSNSAMPLVCDAPIAANADPQYTDVATDKGGVWQGKLAIVVRIDQSAEKLKCVGTGLQRHPTRVSQAGAPVNYLGVTPADTNWIREALLVPVAPGTRQ